MWEPAQALLSTSALSAPTTSPPPATEETRLHPERWEVFSFPSMSPPWGPLAPVPAAAAGADGAVLPAVRGRQTVSFSAAGSERSVVPSRRRAAGGVGVQGMWNVK